MQPMQSRGYPQSRFIGVRHRCDDERLGNVCNLRPQQPTGLIDPRDHRGRRNRQAKQLRNQLRATRERQQLTVGQMHRQGVHVRAILNEFAHAVGKLALVRLPTGAAQLPRAMFGDLVTRNRNVEYLPSLVHLRISRYQSVGPNPTDRGKKWEKANAPGRRAWRPAVDHRHRS